MRAGSAAIASAALACALAGATAGCLRTTSFACSGDPDCSGGTCETNGYCSFDDSTCPSGHRYGDLSGPVANLCVGDETPDIDGPPATIDAPPGTADAPPSLCPGTYMTVGGGAHVYRKLDTPMSWTQQQVICAGEGAYLIIPTDQPELDAVTAFAAAPIWIGIHDPTVEGTYVDVRGGIPAILPWAAGQPDDDPPGEDCVMATGSQISDERCSLDKVAVCECEP